MLLNLFIGDVQFEYIAKYPVKGVKLKVSALGREFFLSADWAKPTRIVRFQQTVHLQCPDDGDGKVSILFEVLAVNCDDYPEKETLLGSGTAVVSPEDHAVGSVIQIKGINGKALLARMATTAFFYVYPIDVAEDPEATKKMFLKGSKSKEYAFLLSRRMNWQEGKPASFDNNLETILSNDVSKNLLAIHKDLHTANPGGSGAETDSIELQLDDLLQGTKHFSALKAKRVDLQSSPVKAMWVSIGSGNMTPSKLRKQRVTKRAVQEAASAGTKKAGGDEAERPSYMSARRSSSSIPVGSNGGGVRNTRPSAVDRRASTGASASAQYAAELAQRHQEAEERRLALAKVHRDRVKVVLEEKALRAEAVKNALEQSRKASEKVRMMLEKKEAELRAVEEKIVAERARARQSLVNSKTVPRVRADEVVNKQPVAAVAAGLSPSKTNAAAATTSPTKSRYSVSPSQITNKLLLKTGSGSGTGRGSPYRVSTGTLVDPVILTRPLSAGRPSAMSASVALDGNVRAQVPLSAYRQRPKSAPKSRSSSESLSSAIKRLTQEERRLMLQSQSQFELQLQSKNDTNHVNPPVRATSAKRRTSSVSSKSTTNTAARKLSVEEIRMMQQQFLDRRAQAILAAAEVQPDPTALKAYRVHNETLAYKPSLEEIRRKQEKEAQQKAMAVLTAMEVRTQQPLPVRGSRGSRGADKGVSLAAKPSLEEIRRRQEIVDEERTKSILASAELRARSVPKGRGARKIDLWGEPNFSSFLPSNAEPRRSSVSVSASVSRSKRVDVDGDGNVAAVTPGTATAAEQEPLKRSRRKKKRTKSSKPKPSSSVKSVYEDRQIHQTQTQGTSHGPSNGRASITLRIPSAYPIRGAIQPSKPPTAPTGRPVPYRYSTSRDSSMIIDDLQHVSDDSDSEENVLPEEENFLPESALVLDEDTNLSANIDMSRTQPLTVDAQSTHSSAGAGEDILRLPNRTKGKEKRRSNAVNEEHIHVTTKLQVRRSRKSSRPSSSSSVPTAARRMSSSAAVATATSGSRKSSVNPLARSSTNPLAAAAVKDNGRKSAPAATASKGSRTSQTKLNRFMTADILAATVPTSVTGNFVGASTSTPRTMTDEELLSFHARMTHAADIAKSMPTFSNEHRDRDDDDDDESEVDNDSIERMRHNLDHGFNEHPELIAEGGGGREGGVLLDSDSDDSDDSGDDDELVAGGDKMLLISDDSDDSDDAGDDDNKDKIGHDFLAERDNNTNPTAEGSYGMFHGRVSGGYTVESLLGTVPLPSTTDIDSIFIRETRDVRYSSSSSSSFPYTVSDGLDSLFLQASTAPRHRHPNAYSIGSNGADLSSHESKVGPISASAREESGSGSGGDSEIDALVNIIDGSHIDTRAGRASAVSEQQFSSSSYVEERDTSDSSSSDSIDIDYHQQEQQPATEGYDQNQNHNIVSSSLNSPGRQVQGLSFRRSPPDNEVAHRQSPPSRFLNGSIVSDGDAGYPGTESVYKVEYGAGVVTGGAGVVSGVAAGGVAAGGAAAGGAAAGGVAAGGAAAGGVAAGGVAADTSLGSSVGDGKGWYWGRDDVGEKDKGDLPDLDESIESLPASVATSDALGTKKSSPEGKLGSFYLQPKHNSSDDVSDADAPPHVPTVVVERFDRVSEALDNLQARVHELTSKPILTKTKPVPVPVSPGLIEQPSQAPPSSSPESSIMPTYTKSLARDLTIVDGEHVVVVSRHRASSQVSQELSDWKYDWVGRVMPDDNDIDINVEGEGGHSESGRTSEGGKEEGDDEEEDGEEGDFEGGGGSDDVADGYRQQLQRQSVGSSSSSSETTEQSADGASSGDDDSLQDNDDLRDAGLFDQLASAAVDSSVDTADDDADMLREQGEDMRVLKSLYFSHEDDDDDDEESREEEQGEGNSEETPSVHSDGSGSDADGDDDELEGVDDLRFRAEEEDENDEEDLDDFIRQLKTGESAKLTALLSSVDETVDRGAAAGGGEVSDEDSTGSEDGSSTDGVGVDELL